MAAHARARDAAAALGFDLGDTRRWTADADASPAAPPVGEPDTLECYVFMPPGTPPAAAAAALGEWRAWCARLVPRFVWSSDALRLRLVPPGSLRARRAGLAGDDTRPLLHGKLHYGDAQGDEWWATWLLVRLSRAHPGAVVHVGDADGDFLAIEAADALPRWFTPATGAHRTFFHGGRVHMVPLPPPPPGGVGGSRGSGSGGLAAVPSLAAGAAYVHAHPQHSLAPARVQRAVSARLATFPGAAAESVHVAACVLPARAARVLLRDPALVAPAVAAFYSRDPSDVQRAARMRAFPPHAGFVRMSVPLSRVLVAQLLMQRYHPPAAMLGGRTAASRGAASGSGSGSGGGGGEELRGGESAVHAPPSLLAAADLPRPGGPGYQAWDLGLKLAAGLEMLLWQGPGWRLLPELLGAAAVAPAPAASSDGEEDAFARYLAALTRRGYFESARTPADKQLKTHRAREYWASARASASGDALPPALGGGALSEGAPPAAADALALEDAAEEVVAPTVSRPEAPSVRVARALLAAAACESAAGGGASAASAAVDGGGRSEGGGGGDGGGDGAATAAATAWPPACDVDDSLSWMDEGAAGEDGVQAGGESAALAAEQRRLTALSQALLQQLGLEPEPGLDDEQQHGGVGGGYDASGGGDGGGEGAMDLDDGGDDDEDGGLSDEDNEDDDDEDDDEDDGSRSFSEPGDDGGADVRQLNELVSTLGGFFKGSSGLDGVAQPTRPATAAKVAGTTAAPFGAGLARSSLAGAFAARPAAARSGGGVPGAAGSGAPRPAPAAPAATATRTPPLTVGALEALLAAHEAALRDPARRSPCAAAADAGGGLSAWPVSPFATAAVTHSRAVPPPWGALDCDGGAADDDDDDDSSWSGGQGGDDDELASSSWGAEDDEGGDECEAAAAARQRGGAGSDGGAPGVGGGGSPAEHDGEGEGDEEEPEPSMAEVMAAMDEALALEGSGSLGTSFATVAGAAAEGGGDRAGGGTTAHPASAEGRTRDSSLLRTAPLSDADVRFNLVTSLMQSVGGQAGGSGPASNLLGQLGLQVPRPWWQEGAREGAPGQPPGADSARVRGT